MDQLRSSIERVNKAGAMLCAPRELALARAHYDFAQTELVHGDAARALRHLALAEANVGAAQVLTPDRGCSSTRSNSDEVSAFPKGSSETHSTARVGQTLSEADGGGHPALPSGAVKAFDRSAMSAAQSTRLDIAARASTLTAYERIGAASALNASPVAYAANDHYSTQARDLCMTTSVKQTRLTPRIYGERRLDGSFEMSYVVLSIGDFEL